MHFRPLRPRCSRPQPPTSSTTVAPHPHTTLAVIFLPRILPSLTPSSRVPTNPGQRIRSLGGRSSTILESRSKGRSHRGFDLSAKSRLSKSQRLHSIRVSRRTVVDRVRGSAGPMEPTRVSLVEDAARQMVHWFSFLATEVSDAMPPFTTPRTRAEQRGCYPSARRRSYDPTQRIARHSALRMLRSAISLGIFRKSRRMRGACVK